MYNSRLLTFLGFLLFLSAYAAGQTTPVKLKSAVQLTGRIVDDQKKPVGYATVTLLRSDSTVVNGDLTKEDGTFNIEVLEAGKLHVRISGIGFANTTINSVVIDDATVAKKLGNITIKPSSTLMKEVQITGERAAMEIAIDKKVFNVEKNITTAGGSASDVLQNVPSVSVDVDGSVSLRGKGNVTILIDGKPATLLGGDAATALQTLPAASISNVEVITNPSSKYDAQGVTGIINIITKKDRKFGFNGSVTAGAGTRDKYNGGININLRNNKWNFFLNSNFRINRNFLRVTTNRANLQNDDSYNIYEDHLRTFGGFFNSVGAEYTLDDRNSFNLTQNLNKMLWGGTSVSTYNIYDRPTHISSSQVRDADNMGTPLSSSTSLDYKHKFLQKNRELSMNVTYARTWVTRTQSFYTSVYDSTDQPMSGVVTQRTPGGGSNSSLNAQADFTTPLSKTARFDAGLKTQLFWFDSYNNPTIDTGLGEQEFLVLKNDYNYSQFTHAAYTTIADQYKNWSYQAGLRLEYAAYQGTTLALGGKKYNNDFLNLFPSAYVSYKLPKDQTVYLNYSRRTNRPGFMQLMPYLDLSNPQDTGMGNPNLIPEFIHNVELNYNKVYKGYNFITGIYYQYTENLIERYRRFYQDGTTFTQPRNLYAGVTYGLDITGKAQLLPIWDATVNVNLFHNEIKGNNVDSTISNSGNSWFGKLNTSVKLSKTLSVQLNANYESPKAASQSTISESYWIDLAVRKNLMNNKATLVLSVSDIFNTRKYTNYYDFSLYTQTMYRDRETRIGNITFTYRFGKADSKNSNNSRRRLEKDRNNLKSDDNSEQGGF